MLAFALFPFLLLLLPPASASDEMVNNRQTSAHIAALGLGSPGWKTGRRLDGY
jgi:hypothetical protein